MSVLMRLFGSAVTVLFIGILVAAWQTGGIPQDAENWAACIVINLTCMVGIAGGVYIAGTNW